MTPYYAAQVLSAIPTREEWGQIYDRFEREGLSDERAESYIDALENVRTALCDGANHCTLIAGEILAERVRHLREEGWSTDHDDGLIAGQLAMAAACYAAPKPILVEKMLPSGSPTEKAYEDPWPLEPEWDKRATHERRRQLIIAASMLVAEVERMDRHSNRQRTQALEDARLATCQLQVDQVTTSILHDYQDRGYVPEEIRLYNPETQEYKTVIVPPLVAETTE